jgi:DNA gyrase subunit A
MMVVMAETSGAEGDPHRQEKIDLVGALIRAIDDMDRINAMVRASVDGKAAMTALLATPFMYTEEQAHHILDMTLRRQTRQSRSDLVAELSRLHRQK